MLVHRRATHNIKFAGTHLYTWEAYEQTSSEGRSKKVVGARREPVRRLTPGWREAL